jgi:hypothetical protein
MPPAATTGVGDGVDDRRNERKRCDLPPDMTAGLPPLRHDDVGSRFHTAAGIGGTSHGLRDKSAPGVHSVHVGGGVAPVERHESHPFLEADIEAVALGPFQDEVHTEWAA